MTPEVVSGGLLFLMNVRPKRTYDLSELGIELGILFNPIGNFSLLPMSDGNWLACFRRYQYYIEGDRCLFFSSPNMFYPDRNHHLFVKFDKDFNLVGRIANPTSTYYQTDKWATGFLHGGKDPFLEDARMTRWGEEIYLTSSIYYYDEWHNKKWATEIQRLEITDDGIEAHHVWNTLERGIFSVEKNWMSVPEQKLKFVAGTSTNGARTVNANYSTVGEICDFDPDDLYGGSTPLVKDCFRKCYYTIAHRYFHGERGRRTYENFVITYDENLKPTHISKPFKFCEQPIEFITTMLELPNNELLIGLTEMDDRPEIRIYDKDEFLRGVNRF